MGDHSIHRQVSSGLGISRPLAIEVSVVVGIWVSIVSMVGKMVSISIVTIMDTSISSSLRFSISGPLAIEVSVVVSIWVSVVSMVGIAKSMSISIVTVMDASISSSFRFGISRPLAIVMSIMVGIRVSIVSIVSIEITSISTCFSFTGSSGEHAQGNNSNRL